MIRLARGDLMYIAIKLGLNFPRDYVKIEARMFEETHT